MVISDQKSLASVFEISVSIAFKAKESHFIRCFLKPLPCYLIEFNVAHTFAIPLPFHYLSHNSIATPHSTPFRQRGICNAWSGLIEPTGPFYRISYRRKFNWNKCKYSWKTRTIQASPSHIAFEWHTHEHTWDGRSASGPSVHYDRTHQHTIYDLEPTRPSIYVFVSHVNMNFHFDVLWTEEFSGLCTVDPRLSASDFSPPPSSLWNVFLTVTLSLSYRALV